MCIFYLLENNVSTYYKILIGLILYSIIYSLWCLENFS